ncbi:hypothetical protein ACFL9T_21240 [Thermodesulfobacteriota bacterium]
MIFQNNNPGHEPELSEVCPVSGLSILQKPKWVDVDLGKNYRATLSLLGPKILLSQPSGYITLPDVKNALSFIEKTTEELFGVDGTYVFVEDFANLQGATMEARKYYIEYFKKNNKILGLIFYSASSFFTLSIKLGKRLNLVKYDVRIENNYEDAVHLAIKILKESHPQSIDSEVDHRSPNPFFLQKQQNHYEVVTNPDWRLELNGFSAKLEIINGNILHSCNHGLLQEEHVEPVTKMREKMLEKCQSL